MKKIILTILSIMMLYGNCFAQEKIEIPKTGMLEKPIKINSDSIIVYRDEAVLIAAKTDTKISPIGNFLMEVHIMPTDLRTRNKYWNMYINDVCSSWRDDDGRLPVSPTRVVELIFFVEVNETKANCRIYGLSMYEHQKEKAVKLFSAIENSKARFHTQFEPLDKAVFF